MSSRKRRKSRKSRKRRRRTAAEWLARLKGSDGTVAVHLPPDFVLWVLAGLFAHLDRRGDSHLADLAEGALLHGGALAGHDDSFARKNLFRIGGHHDLRLGRYLLDGLGHRTQVAHAVIDDRDAHLQDRPEGAYSVPLVEGMVSAARGSGSSAMRSARANALNIVSHW